MAGLLLACIYMAFISLGLPDGLLGAAWPVMHETIDAPLASAGVISFIITVGTIISSLLSDRLSHRFGTGLVTVFSVGMTAAALFGFSLADAFWQVCLLALPYGLGAGAIDAALNNYVALHYKARHMSWLHCFWGIGASIGPYIMGAFLTGTHGWPGGYRTVSLIQIVLTAVLMLSLPLWKQTVGGDDTARVAPLGLRNVVKIPGVKTVMITFFAYCAAEMTIMLWASSYFTEYRHMPADTAASVASLFYMGMMIGRFFSGLLAERFSDKTLIRVGVITALAATTLIALPLSTDAVSVVGLLLLGLGCAPIYPCIIHSTPVRFNKQLSQSIIGVEMASAYAGSSIAPPIFGLIADHISAGWFSAYIGILFITMLILSERLNRLCPET